ncbi:MAG: histidine triad nucleotide-binding protein, partial [Pseudomonadota bacterium]|nr:histidine triad nucleotide-binding protein [Pseudomonadota bacterium]
MAKSIFTKILDGEIPGDILFEDEVCFAIKDINPQAP